MADPVYKAYPMILKSKGLVARWAPDQPPDHSYWLNLNSALERAETAMSSRYGSIIINRDPIGIGTSNYLLPAAPATLSRLFVAGTSPIPYRYAGLVDGSLYRRATDVQGQYSSILGPGSLSGNPFSALVNVCPQSSKPFLFIYDSKAMYKDSGTGTPVGLGILPPIRAATTAIYAPLFQTIEVFSNAAGYTTTGSLTVVAAETAFTTSGGSGGAILGGDHFRYVGNPTPDAFYRPPDGMLAASSAADGVFRLKFQTKPKSVPLFNTGEFDIVSPNAVYPNPDTFTFPDVHTTVASNATGTIGKTLPVTDLSAYDPADLIVIALKVSAPQNVQEIRIQFDVANSGYLAGYYTKTLIPISYQGYLTNPQTSSAVIATNNQIYQQGILANSGDSPSVGTLVRRNRYGSSDMSGDFNAQVDSGGGGGDIGSSGISPSQLPSGTGTWAVIYLQKGDFLPVGNAGQPGLDWANITGWRIQVSTNSGGSSDVSFNALYIQGGGVSASPVVPSSGPSSYGGVGYDIRYRYYNANTGTPSNPSRSQLFSVTPGLNPGGVSTVFPLRQAINVTGRYSADPQVTHVQVYVRGGLFGSNWYYADQFPNVTGTGDFSYKYSLPDSVLSGGDILKLDNDAPFTVTLNKPIATTLSAAISPSPATYNTPTLVTVTTSDATSVFVPNQIVFIGNPNNLEETVVVAGGTGTFTCWIQLPHSYLEPVRAFSLPAVPMRLAAIAYGQTWHAGDPNNPHYLYYTPKGYPENAPPQNYVPVGSPTDPITLVIEYLGLLFVSTFSTWYQIFPGNPPYARKTGAKHGAVASFGWALGEGEIWYQASDGIRTFKGTDGAYRTLLLEWLFRNVAGLTPVPLFDLTKLSSTVIGYRDIEAFIGYTGLDGKIHRINYYNPLQRWRNDDVPMTAVFLETDTDTLVYAKQMSIGGVTGYAIVSDSYNQDYDDGGWVSNALVKLPILWTIQTPYDDQKAPNNPKQYNTLTIDANPNGNTLTPILLFDDDNGNVNPVFPLPNTFTGTVRSKYQFSVNLGEGQQAYRASLVLTGGITQAPEIYQADIEAAILTAIRGSYDSYWVKFGTDMSKVAKDVYIDYTSAAPILVNIFLDGDLNNIVYTFTLPANPNRLAVPIRERLFNQQGSGARLFRLLRMVATTLTSPLTPFQLWSPIQFNIKVIGAQGKGYSMQPLGGLAP